MGPRGFTTTVLEIVLLSHKSRKYQVMDIFYSGFFLRG